MFLERKSKGMVVFFIMVKVMEKNTEYWNVEEYKNNQFLIE